VKIPEDAFVTSDFHFCHDAIRLYCNRPFASTEEMNETMIENFNKVVGKKDTTIFLGDFAFAKKEEILAIRKRLHGKFFTILGNHDREHSTEFWKTVFEEVSEYPVIFKDFMVLTHEPLWLDRIITGCSVYGELFGHVHNNEMYKNITSQSYNCCVDVNNYTPIRFTEAFEKMKSVKN
jgi:calcineurin-like phosphoesterase family protein